jgi:hypothetical protein
MEQSSRAASVRTERRKLHFGFVLHNRKIGPLASFCTNENRLRRAGQNRTDNTEMLSFRKNISTSK